MRNNTAWKSTTIPQTALPTLTRKNKITFLSLIFSTSNTEDSDDDSDSSSSAQKKRRRKPQNINGTFYGPSATRIVFDLAAQLGKNGTDLVW
jgi:hypothetical protein